MERGETTAPAFAAEWKIRGYSYKQRAVLMTIKESKYKKNMVTCYTPSKGTFYKPLDKIIEYMRNFNLGVLVVRKHMWDKDGKLTIEEAYDNFINIAIKMNEVDKSINLLCCGSYKIMALRKFWEMTESIRDKFEWLTKEENLFVKESYRGALIFHKNYEGEAYYYDVTSAYPYIMSHSQFRVPIGQGTVKNITSEEFEQMTETYFSCGIYRVEIKGYDKRLFRPSLNHYYTHIDLTYAKKRNYEMKLICDSEPNCITYGKEQAMSGHQVFRNYVDYFYEYKEAGHKEFKPLLNVLHGAFIESNILTTVKSMDEEIEINPDMIVDIRQDFDKGLIEIDYMPLGSHGQIFKTPLARVCPFLLSQGRVMMASFMENQVDSVVRCHTDGWYMSEPLSGPFHESIKVKPICVPRIGDRLGDLTHKYYEEIAVKNSKVTIYV